MKKKLLWLDDVRNPYTDDWLIFSPIGRMNIDVIWVKNYAEFIDYILINGLPDAICFDHDLGYDIDPNVDELKYFKGEISVYSLLPYNDEEKTGYDCAKWLVNYCIDRKLKLPLYNIQSANPVGKENIDMLFKNYNKFI